MGELAGVATPIGLASEAARQGPICVNLRSSAVSLTLFASIRGLASDAFISLTSASPIESPYLLLAPLGSQHAKGIAVFRGKIGVTILGLF